MSETNSVWDITKAAQAYSIERWGTPYFSISSKGALCVSPTPGNGVELAIKDVVDAAKQRGLHLPMVIRFQDILRNRVETLNAAFQQAITEYSFKSTYRGVFPIKVNQLREVVEEILDAGAPFHYGLEAGSKPELTAALALHKDPESLIICNGYKDEDFVRLALLGVRLGKQVVMVVEKLEELSLILCVSRQTQVRPLLGFRVKLQVKSSGKWATSSGENAKFGLSAIDLIEACEMLEAEGYGDSFKLMHFHVGSQIPDIQVVKRAVREAARYYAKLRKMGFPVAYFDIGGGLGIDYDGSRSATDSSTNYTMQEYCSDVVYNLGEVCDAEEVPHPTIISESGRAIVGHHSVLVVEAFAAAEKTKHTRPLPQPGGNHKIVEDILSLLTSMKKGSKREALHDAQELRDTAESMFGLGLLDLKSKAHVDQIYWHVAERSVEFFEGAPRIPEEIKELAQTLGDQYICNFSVFQSLLDHWAVGQIFPIAPLHRLDEEPTLEGTLVDITCDSDGKVAKFIDNEGCRATLPLHRLDGSEYLIGFFLVGAYQDVMGDIHNLFGRVNEAHVFLDPDEDDGYYIEETIEGRTVKDVLEEVQYNSHEIISEVKAHVDAAIKRDAIKPNEGMRLLEEYERVLKGHTYLKVTQPV